MNIDRGLYIVPRRQESNNSLPERLPGFKDIIHVTPEDLEKEAWSFAVDYASDVFKRINGIIRNVDAVLTQKDEEKLLHIIGNEIESAKLYLRNPRHFLGSPFGQLWDREVVATLYNKMSEYDDLLASMSKSPITEFEKASDRLLEWKKGIEGEEKKTYEKIIENILSIVDQQIITSINMRFNTSIETSTL